MFQWFHKTKRDAVLAVARQYRGRRSGQTALVLVLFIAIALVFYAISLNWGKVTQFKTITTIASNTAAGSMASFVASVGEQQVQVTLGGRPRYCAATSIWVSIATVLITIGSLIATLLYPPNALWAFVVLTILSSVSVVVAGASLAIQAAVIQPGLTRMWNKMQQNAPIEDQVVENGISTGLQAAVTDTQTIYDHFDMDMDGIWVDKGGINFGSPSSQVPDEISRFSYFYTMRLRKLKPIEIPEVNNFLRELNDLVYLNPYNKVGPPVEGTTPSGCSQEQQDAKAIECNEPDQFALFDPGCDPKDPNPSPYCNPCCIAPASETSVILCNRSRGTSCPAGEYPDNIGQFDLFYENRDNDIFSFREKLGLDDENKKYMKVDTNPNLTQRVDTGNVFRQEDATGYFTEQKQIELGLSPPLEADKRKGVFPFFWEMDGFVEAVAVGPLPKTDSVTKILFDPAVDRLKAQENQCALQQWNSDSGVQLLDNEGLPIVGDDAITPIQAKGFWWKPGSDRYCSERYPYSLCESRPGSSGACHESTGPNDPQNCGCFPSVAKDWNEDPLDFMAYGLPQLIAWSEEFISTDIDTLLKTFTKWYEQAALFIAPKCAANDNCHDTLNGEAACAFCNNAVDDSNNGNDGLLLIWRDQLRDWTMHLDNWLYRQRFNDDNAQCLREDLSRMAPYEMDAINEARAEAALSPVTDFKDIQITPPAEFGTLSDTIACLNTNKEILQKYTECRDHCAVVPQAMIPNDPSRELFSNAAQACLNLPRASIDVYQGIPSGSAVSLALARQAQACLMSTCSDIDGNILSVCMNIPNADHSSFTNTSDPTLPCGNFGPGQPFYQAVLNIRDRAFDTSDLCRTDTDTTFETNLQAVLDDPNTEAQAVAFEARHKYLTNLKAQAENARAVFYEGYKKLNDFLKPCVPGGKLGDGCEKNEDGSVCLEGGPVAQLICARINYVNPAQLSNFAIYGWQSKPVEERANQNKKGYWHIVRVEAFSPKRCFKQCDIDRFPRVDNYTKGFLGTTRCYVLEDHTGTVMTRVTRYDENHDTSIVNFANGQKLWNFRFDNPGSSSDETTAGLDTACQLTPAGRLRFLVNEMSGKTNEHINRAFLINGVPRSTGLFADTDYNDTCFRQVQRLLERGVQTTTCAQYFLDEPINHMSMKFVPCNMKKFNDAVLGTESGFAEGEGTSR